MKIASRFLFAPILALVAASTLGGCALSGADATEPDDSTVESAASTASLTGKFEASSFDAWTAGFNKLELNANGTYVATTSRMCITTPCPPLVETGRATVKLGRDGLRGTLKLDPTGRAATHTHTIVIGKDGFTLFTIDRRGSATFAREKPACIKGGCSGQLCVEEGGPGLVTTCEFRPEYACFREHGVCERSAETGSCGWRESDELTACISAAKEPYCNLIDCKPGFVCDNDLRACIAAE